MSIWWGKFLNITSFKIEESIGYKCQKKIKVKMHTKKNKTLIEEQKGQAKETGLVGKEGEFEKLLHRKYWYFDGDFGIWSPDIVPLVL